jgi:ABC-type uncharacterized transport system auxiliary subunit
MIRRVLCVALVMAVAGLVCGCDKPPVSTNPDAPLKSGEGVDKKGRKTKTMEVSIEDPNARK